MPRRNQAIKVACRLCHDRRVRCDRSEGIACSNCRNARRDCEPIVSRRGRRRKLPLLPTTRDADSSLVEPSRSVPYGQVKTSNPLMAAHVQGDRERQQQNPSFPALGPNGKTPYVGDASNLNYLMQQLGDLFGSTDARPLQDHLQAAMLAQLGKPTTQAIKQFNISTLDHIKQQGAFDLPSQETSQALLDAYFHYSLAALPILDRSRLLVALEDGSFSHLLLNSIYLAASIYCSDSVISDAGFVSRYAASLTFYRRAKFIYDAGYETDAIATIQATFLICHWWSGLLEQKDPWYWLGICTGMAQAMGMHQAKSYIRLEEKDRKIWRRLWWMIYAMDINLSMLLDRPPHVQGRLCNVPALSEADFEQANGSNETETFGETLNGANTFAIHAVQLAWTVDRFFTIKFDEDTGHSQDVCLKQIALWSSSLPPEFKSLSTNSSTWAILTQLLYQEYRLLLHRSNPRFSANIGPGSPTFEICTEISHMLEIVVANDLVYAAGASIIAPVLSVLSIHIVNMRRGDPGVQMISEHRARFCMTIVHKLQSRFPVVAAFCPIYDTLLNRNLASGQAQGGMQVPDRPATRSLMQPGPFQLNDQSDPNSSIPAEASVDQFLPDGMGAMFPFSFSFGNLFEDIFLSSPSQPTLFCEDDISSPR